MAALVEGLKYGLSSRASTSASKSVVHVKLTDSALRAIEEFQKIKDVTSRRPKIQFSNSNGVIRVPIKKSSDNPEGFRTFSISLSALQGDPKGSFDCVQQSTARREEPLQLLGSMTNKIVIQASDDVYKTTKEKMTLAEVQSKKACAKEIKPSGPYIGRKVKKVVKRSDIPPHKSRNDIMDHISSSHKPLPRTELDNIAAHSRHSTGNGHHSTVSHSSGGSGSHSQKSSISQRSSPHSLSSSHSNHHVSSSQKSSQSPQNPMVSSNTNSGGTSHKGGVHSPSQASGKSSPNPAVYSLPYRDRVIHLLAIRPYKKPELIARLQRDGVKEKDRKNSSSSILNQVAVFGRDNSYTLIKNLYAEVRSDWPGYTDGDRLLLKRRMAVAQDCNSAGSSPVALSPAHSVSSQGSPTSSQKRPTSTTDEPHPSKKQRIAHVKKGKEVRNDASPVDSILPVKREATTTTLSPDSSHDDSENRKENRHSNHDTSDKSVASSTSETPEYVLKYIPVTSAEQRTRYKQDFNSQYDEYRDMHKNIEQVTKRFKELEASLRLHIEGSDDYENIKNKIFSEYKSVRKDPKYIEQRKRCDYLHKKLGHIKKIILEYDQLQMMDS